LFWPWYMLIGFPRRMSRVKEKYAMSGRPQGPYTVKNLSPVIESPYMWLYVCAISSPAFFVAA